MNETKTNINKFKISKVLFIIVFFLFFLILLKLCYLCLIDYKVGNSTITAFINNRNIEEETIMPNRGTIYDNKGNVLAQDVASYTVIAYLSSTRSENSKEQLHVSDIDFTAESLASILNMTKEDLVILLSKDAYQVELGPGGRNLSQLEMEAIQALELPGIDFIKNTKRYYPNGDFASYLIGYTKDNIDKSENIWKDGELGIEEYYNTELSGETGFVTYEKDKNGYKIPNGREYKEDADNGDNIYLTIDNNVELFVENALKTAQSESEAEWGLMLVTNAKTGAILGYSSTPSYDPNIRNLTNYLDPIVSYAYEPGSTMKIFSYLCAIESGKYNGEDTYESGSKTYESEIDNDTVTIKDWNKKGWGTISYDQGFLYSSNIAVANLVETIINKNDLSACYTKYGFGASTGFTLNREEEGSIKFEYQVEVATAGYGQGITVTPIQFVQALSIIANDGEMIKPYVVEKIVDSDTNKVTYQAKVKNLGKVASTESIEKMKELMYQVVQPDSSLTTGYAYYMEGYDLIGKTGTAQLYDYTTGKYLTGNADYIYSFAGLYPKEDPEIIIYMALKKPKDATNYIAPAIKKVIEDVSKYLNIDNTSKTINNYTLKDYTNSITNDVKEELLDNELNVLVLGNGNKIINQYPSKYYTVTKGDLVVLLTNNYNKEIIDFTGYSYKELINILKLLNIKYTIEGKGYVISQNIEPGTILTEDQTLEIILKEKNIE